ncbi:MAG: zinc-binding alcohol dehydrogenase family protein [Thermoplasmata archaeon]
MKAAIVREFGNPPYYGDFADPAPQPGETVVSVTATAVSTVVRGRASGAHYSAGTALPFVPGVDGVGRTPEGRRVYFAFPRPPFGSMAERVVISADRLVPLPEGLDDATAAAAANPGMSCWIPLTLLSPIHPGESVLVNGATGVSGRMAIQVAKHLGARKVIATGRDEAKLRTLPELGADVVLSLRQPAETFRDALRKEARDSDLGVVLDYLWGPSAETILAALGGPNAPRGASRIRYVQIGTLAGTTISLEGSKLRSSGVEILGSGLGSSTDRALVAGIGQFLTAFVTGRFRIAIDVHPLSDVERAWSAAPGEKRLVFSVP